MASPSSLEARGIHSQSTLLSHSHLNIPSMVPAATQTPPSTDTRPPAGTIPPISPGIVFDIAELCVEIAHHISDIDTAITFRALTRNSFKAVTSNRACRALTLLAPASTDMVIQFTTENDRVPFLLPGRLRSRPLDGTTVTVIRLHPAVTPSDESFMTMVRLQVTSRGLLAPGFYREMFLTQPPQVEIQAHVFITRAITERDDMRVTSFRVTIRRAQGIRLCDLATRVNPLALLWSIHSEPLAVSWFATKSLTETSPFFAKALSNSLKATNDQTDFKAI